MSILVWEVLIVSIINFKKVLGCLDLIFVFIGKKNNFFIFEYCMFFFFVLVILKRKIKEIYKFDL